MSLLESDANGKRRCDKASVDSQAKTKDSSSSSEITVARAFSVGFERNTTVESMLRSKERADGDSNMSSVLKTLMSQSIARLAGFFHLNKDKGEDSQPASSDDFLPKFSSNSDDGPPAPTSGNDDDDDEPDFNMDITMRVTADFMNSYQVAFREEDLILRPADSRMQKLKFTIHD